MVVVLNGAMQYALSDNNVLTCQGQNYNLKVALNAFDVSQFFIDLFLGYAILIRKLTQHCIP